MSQENSSRRGIVLAFTVLIVAGFLQYFRILRAPVDCEALGFIAYPLTMGQYSSFWDWLLKNFVEVMGFIRPIPFMIQGALIVGLKDYGFVLHLLNILVLLGISMMITLLLLKEGVKFPFALGAGLIALLHPINALNVVKTTHLGNLLGALFALIALYIYIRSRDKSKKRWAYLPEGILVAAALFSYELYVVLPLLLPIYEFFIKAKGKPKGVNVGRLLPSVIIWSALSAIYAIIRYLTFRGIGGYNDLGGFSLTPVLKGGYWITGFGFFHLSGQPVGAADVLLFVVLAAVTIFLIFRRSIRHLLLFAGCWFVGASLPFFFIPATYYYVFAFAAFGMIIALAFCLADSFPQSGKGIAGRLVLILMGLLIIFWVRGSQLGVAYHLAEIDNQDLPAKALYDHIGQGSSKVNVYLVAEDDDRHLEIRLALLLYPTRLVLTQILYADANTALRLLSQQQSPDEGATYFALRQGRNISFYSSAEVLRAAAQNLPLRESAAGMKPRSKSSSNTQR